MKKMVNESSIVQVHDSCPQHRHTTTVQVHDRYETLKVTRRRATETFVYLLQNITDTADNCPMSL